MNGRKKAQESEKGILTLSLRLLCGQSILLFQ
jgi:hypothetical protein